MLSLLISVHRGSTECECNLYDDGKLNDELHSTF